VDEALPSPVHETTLPVQVELARLRLDDYSAVVAAASFTQGNDVQPRPDVNSSDGYNGVRIVGRAPGGRESRFLGAPRRCQSYPERRHHRPSLGLARRLIEKVDSRAAVY
jgi:hypothetical protein